MRCLRFTVVATLLAAGVASGQTLPVGGSGGSGSAAITVGTTTVTGGTDTRILFDNAGVVNESANARIVAGVPTFVGPVLGTPASATLTLATGLPISTGVSGLGTGVATFLGTPSSANLIAAVTDETGSGALVFGTAPQISTIELGNASDTTLARSQAGVMTVEGQHVATWETANAWSGSNTITAGTLVLSAGTAIGFVDLNYNRIQYRSETTPDSIQLNTGSIGNSWIVAETADAAFDWQNGHCGTSACADPTISIRSHNQDTTNWVDIYNNGTNGVIDVGSGGLNIADDVIFTANRQIYAHANYPMYIGTNGVWAIGCTNVTCAGTSAFFTIATGSGGPIGLSGSATTAPDVFFERAAAATLQLGAPNAASPVNQTLQSQGSRGATDSNVAGGTLTLASGDGTGTGTASSVVIQTPTVAASGTTQQTMATRATVSSAGLALTVPVSTYQNVATTGWGVPAIYGTNRSTAQTAAVASVATYTVGAADGSFEVSANVLVTTATTHSFSVQVDYTDESNVARTLTLPMAQLAGTFVAAITNVTGAGPYEGAPLRIRCKASTAITIKTTGTFTTVTYNVEGAIVQVS